MYLRESLSFPACRKRLVEADFAGGHVSSNGGVVLLRQVDRLLGLTAAVAGKLDDTRQRGKVRHRLLDMVRQRRLCDRARPRGFERPRSTAPRSGDADGDGTRRSLLPARADALPLREPGDARVGLGSARSLGAQNFLAAHPTPPEEIVLDIDATDDAVHGRQVGRFFHGYYDHYCFLPLYVFAGDHLLVAYLRPANIDGAKHFRVAVIKLLICETTPPGSGPRHASSSGRIRASAAGGYLGVVRQEGCRLHRRSGQEPPAEAACGAGDGRSERDFTATGEKQRRFVDLNYGCVTIQRSRWTCDRLPDTDHALASQPTLSRLENIRRIVASTGAHGAETDSTCTVSALRTVLLRHIVLDIDDTTDRTHGAQQLSTCSTRMPAVTVSSRSIFTMRHHKSRCPLHTAGPANDLHGEEVALILTPRDPAHSAPTWPRVAITVRGDGHYDTSEVMDLLEKNGCSSCSRSDRKQHLETDLIQRLVPTRTCCNTLGRVAKSPNSGGSSKPLMATNKLVKACSTVMRTRVEATEKGTDVRYISHQCTRPISNHSLYEMRSTAARRQNGKS